MATKKISGVLDGFKTAAEIIRFEKESDVCIPTGPNLDVVLGGGIPSGTFVLLRTKTGCGKTTFCMSVVRNALLQGRKVFFFDVEGRMDTKKYYDIEGFDVEDKNFMYFGPDEKQLAEFSAEKILSKQIHLMQMKENYGALYVIDSFSKLVAHEVLTSEEVSGSRRSSVPKIQTDWLAKAANYIRATGSVVIGVQHLMLDQSARPSSHTGPAYKPKGAEAFGYEADIILESQFKPKDLSGNSQFKEDNLTGLSLQLRIPKNKRRGPLNTKEGVTTYLKFGKGIWFAREMVDQLQGLTNTEDPELPSLLKRKGAWYKFNLPEIQENVQGVDGAIEVIENNQEYFEELHKKIMIEIHEANYKFK